MGVPRIIKISTIIFILSAGLIGSYLIFKDSNPAAGNEVGAVKENEQPIKNSTPWAEKNGLNNSDDKLMSDNQSKPLKNNFTQALGQSIFEEIKPLVKASQNGEKPNFDINLMSGGLTKDIFKNQSLDLNLVYEIDDSKLKISQDNSRKAKINYLITTGEINKKEFGDFNKNYLEIIMDVFQKGDFSSANQLASIYKNLANDYFNIEVPSDWVDFHKKMIIFFKNSETIYSAMANFTYDPVKSYLALELVEKISIDNAQEIEDLINKKIKEVR